MSSPILVTGGRGLVGSALREVLPQGAHFLSRKDGDLRDLSQVRQLFRNLRPERIIHLAARVGGVKMNAAKNADMFMENILINTNVLMVAQEVKVKKLVTVLSNCVFRDKIGHPPQESEIYDGVPYMGHRGYGFAKRMLDLQIQLMRVQYEAVYTSITPVTIFGPNDHWDIENSHVVGSLIQKCFNAKKENAPFVVWGTGNAVRQFVYVKDIAKILQLVLDRYDDPETIIVAPSAGKTIREIAMAIAKNMGFSGEIIFDSSKPEGELKRVLDSSKFTRVFPDFEFTAFEDAIKETIQSFLKEKEFCA